MCMFCELVEDEQVFAETPEDPDAAAARRRQSQASWERLMEEIARSDAARGGGEAE